MNDNAQKTTVREFIEKHPGEEINLLTPVGYVNIPANYVIGENLNANPGFAESRTSLNKEYTDEVLNFLEKPDDGIFLNEKEKVWFGMVISKEMWKEKYGVRTSLNERGENKSGRMSERIEKAKDEADLRNTPPKKIQKKMKIR